MTLKEKIGQFFFPAVFINDTEENIQEIEKLIAECHIGGLTFFHSRASAATNYEGKKKIKTNDQSYDRLKELILRYQKCARIPLLISIDAEWGLAMRVEKTPQYPYAITLGALPESELHLVYEVGKQIGLNLKAAGINYNLAPLADINNNPKNPVIGYRSFGEKKEKVAQYAVAYLKGMSDVGVLGCLKHFPGHGNTSVDSHLDLPILEEDEAQLAENELYPFVKGIANNVDSIMIGHLAVPKLNEGKNTSATLSKPIIETLLRKQLGYEGLVISDALNMHSVSKLYSKKGQLEWEAFNAGNDVLCFAENVREGIQEIFDNATPERIEASYNRIAKCKEKVSAENQNNGSIDFEATSDLNFRIAQNCLTEIKNNANTQTVFQAKENNTLAKISIYKTIENTFFRAIEPNLSSPEFAIQLGDDSFEKELEHQLTPFDTILIALYVPKAKPYNNFDIETSVLQFLDHLFSTKKCVLYVFGNPYVLQIIPNLNNASGVIQAYQDFVEFQQCAANQLMEDLVCKGELYNSDYSNVKK
jgi:beta-N-acetylhexosaminidase